jgi:hypothetical protein
MNTILPLGIPFRHPATRCTFSTVMTHLLGPILAVFCFATALQGQTTGDMRAWLPLPAGKLDGWTRTLGGERFSYITAHPTLSASLLVRSLDSTNAAEWETAPIPADFAGDTVEFVWLNALDVADPGQPPVIFHVELNGREVLRLPQPRDTLQRRWSVDGDDGLQLSFRVLMVDRYGDEHGIMSLRVPVDRYARARRSGFECTAKA